MPSEIPESTPLNPKRLDNRTLVLLLTAAIFAGFNIVYAILIYLTGDNVGGPVMMYVIVAATLGGAIGESQSLNKIEADPSFTSIAIKLFWRLLSSGILAVFGYAVFAAGIIQGALFPAFATPETEFAGMTEFLSTYRPSTHADMAKVLVWAFIAGYSQKFVVQIITHLEKSWQERFQADERP